MIFRRILIGSLISFLTLWFLFFWVVSLLGPTYLTQKAAAKGYDLSIEKIHTNYLHKITLHNIKIKKPVEGFISRARFSVRPWEFFRTGQLFFLDLKEPRIQITSKPNTGPQSSAGPFLFRLRIRTSQGQIVTSIANKQLLITNLSGYTDLGPLGVFGRFSGTPNDAGAVAMSFSIPSIWKSWNARLSSDALDMGRLADDLRQGDSGLLGRLNDIGKVAVNAEINSEKITIHSVKILEGINLTGFVKSWAMKPVLDLKLSAENVPLQGLGGILFPRSSNSLLGDISFETKIQGPLPHPQLNGTFATEAQYGDFRMPKLAGAFSYREGLFNSSSTFSSGFIRLYNTSKNSGTYIFSIRDLDLSAVAQQNGWKNVKGAIHAEMSCKAKEIDASLKGRFALNDFQWGRIKSDPVKKGELEFNPRLLRIQTDDGTFGIKGNFTTKVAKLDDFHFRFGSESEVMASGVADFESKRINMTVAGNKIPPDLWPPLVALYPDIQGSLDLSGDVSGSLYAPQSELDMSFNQLKFIPTGGQWNGTAELIGTNQEFTIKNMKVDGGYTGDLTWKNGVLAFDGNLSEASPRLICDVLKKTTVASGFITGPLNVKWNGSYLTGGAAVEWSKGQIGEFFFDTLSGRMNLAKDEWNLSQVQLIKGASAIRLEGLGKPVAQGWTYQTTVQLQQWGKSPVVIDGEVHSEGTVTRKFDVSGTIGASTLWIQNNPLENLSAMIRKSGDQWSLCGKTGEETQFQIDLHQKTKAIRGTVNAESVSMGTWFDALGANMDSDDKLTGKMDLQGQLTGTLEDPLMNISAQIKEGVWKAQPFQAEVGLALTPSLYTIQPSVLRFVSGGRVSISGSVEGEKTKKIILEGNGQSVALNSLFGFLNWSLKLDGQSDFSFNFMQQQSSQSIHVELKGIHQGVGLFKKPGEIRGVITGNLKELDLSGLRITSGGGYVRLLNGSRAFIEKDGSGRLRLPLELRNMSAGLLVFFGNVDIAGSWDGKTLAEENRTTSLDVFARSLWLNQYYFDGNITRLTLKKGLIGFSPIPGSGQQLSGELVYKNFPKIQVNKFRLSERGTEKVFLDGEIGRGAWNYKLELRGVDAAIIGSLMDRTLPISGPMDINAQAKGTYDNPVIQADVLWKKGQIYGVPLDSAEGVVHYKKDQISIEKIIARKNDGFEIIGTIRPDEIDFKIKNGDLKILTEMTPEVSRARGSFEGFVKSRLEDGRWKNTGRILVQKIAMRTHHVPNVENGVIELSLQDDHLNIVQARVDSGAGRIVCEGNINFEGLRPTFLNVKLYTPGGKGVWLRVPELAIKPGPVLGRLGTWGQKLAGISQGEALIDLTFSGPTEAPSVTGDIKFSKTTFTYPPTKSKDPQTTTFSKWVRTYLSGISWDVKLSALVRAWFQNELVNAALTGNIRFQGKLGSLDINGRFDSEQGSIVYSGNEFSIKQATLEIETKKDAFSSDKTEKKNYVYLRATAEREVFYTDSLSSSNQDTIVMIVDRSLLGEIQPRFSAKNNPNLSSQKALQLALGLPLTGSIEDGALLPDQRVAEQERSRVENDKFLRAGLIQLLDSSLASPLARALAQNTGLVDFVRVTYQEHDPLARDEFDPSGESSNDVTDNEFLKYAKGTKVKFGRGISRRLSADYSFRVDEYQERLDLRHEVELAYRLKQSLFLRGITELDSERTLGRPPDRRAILENQWRFGLPRKKKPKQIN